MSTVPVYVHIIALLTAGGFGDVGWELFGAEWGDQDQQTLVLNGVGVPTDLKELYEQPGIQILCRGKKGGVDADVYERAKSISDYLLTLPERVEVDGVCYTGFEPDSSIAALGKDENQRFNYSMNFSTFRNTI